MICEPQQIVQEKEVVMSYVIAVLVSFVAGFIFAAIAGRKCCIIRAIMGWDSPGDKGGCS